MMNVKSFICHFPFVSDEMNQSDDRTKIKIRQPKERKCDILSKLAECGCQHLG